MTTTTLNQGITDTNSQFHTSQQTSINNLSFAPEQSMVVDQFRQTVNNGNYINNTVPVGAFIKQNVKISIANGEFIYFKDILKKNYPKDSNWIISKNDSSISLSQNDSKEKDLTLCPEWVRAWNIYMPLVCMSKPDHSLPLKMAYHYQQVQQLYDSGLDWSYYDQRFRQLLASPLEIRGDLDWGSLHSESWLKVKS